MTPPQLPEADIAQLRVALAQARGELQEFMHTVSHDLRAPLRHITSYARILQEDLGPEVDGDVAQSLQAIVQAAEQQGRLIDGLMALARVRQMPVQWVPVDMQALLQDVCADLQRTHAAELATRQVQWQLASMPVVTGDAALLRLVMQQVLGNALKFSRGRTPSVIEVGMGPMPGAAGPSGASDAEADPPAGDFHQMYVRDNGVGFNPQYQDKLFRVFSRLHSATAFEGVGTGLAMCRAALASLGGFIAISAAVGQGCTVSWRWPVLPQVPAEPSA
ncbi:MAG: hypothetical protein RJA34_1793 [Pseudomonadota bacterium]|jgi:light-regulated signal transduction histidine kinase (bacteriophytochrome)